MQSLATEYRVARAVAKRSVVEPRPAAFDWRAALPVLGAGGAVLRELRGTDAPALMALLQAPDVSRFLNTPPTSLDGFGRFIDWLHTERAQGRVACFAVVPEGSDRPAGMYQVRALDEGFETAEWGFVIAPEYWGSGLFRDSADHVLSFVFNVLGVRRLEARSLAANQRGNGALRKLGTGRHPARIVLP